MNLGSCTLLGLILDEKFLFLDAMALPGSTKRPFKKYYHYFLGGVSLQPVFCSARNTFSFLREYFFFFFAVMQHLRVFACQSTFCCKTSF